MGRRDLAKGSGTILQRSGKKVSSTLCTAMALAALRLASVRVACVGVACVGVACVGVACVGVACVGVACVGVANGEEGRWKVGNPLVLPGPKGSFDEVAAKDPSIVFHEGRWHLFYTARGSQEYTTGYVSAPTLDDLKFAPRHELDRIRGQRRYGCAPQVFYFEPQQMWYLLFQNRDANYQPAYSTTRTISDPQAWSEAQPLIQKDSPDKWIDFWIICDRARAYLFYTQRHRDVMVRSAPLDQFPAGWGEAQVVLQGVHEAVHVYRVRGQGMFHMIYELNRDGLRAFGLATSGELNGPWTKVTDEYATRDQLVRTGDSATWTDMVSHGEAIRCGFDQRLQYDPADGRWLIQGILEKDLRAGTPYPSLPWKLGIITRVGADRGS